MRQGVGTGSGLASCERHALVRRVARRVVRGRLAWLVCGRGSYVVETYEYDPAEDAGNDFDPDREEPAGAEDDQRLRPDGK